MRFLKYFSFGILSAFGALILELTVKIIFYGEQYSVSRESINQISSIIVIALLIEEILKFLFISVIAREIPERKKIFFFSFLVGLGFAMVEIAFNLTDGSLIRPLLYFQLFGLLLLHVYTAGLAGFFIAKMNGLNIFRVSGILLITGIVHLLYNAAVIYDHLDFLFLYFPSLTIILILMFLSFRDNKKLV